MKRILASLLILTLATVSFAGCGKTDDKTSAGVKIELSDSGITVDGEKITAEKTTGVYAANDIVYYEEGHDFTYGDGNEDDAHNKDEADAHTVIHITQPGNYTLSGKITKGQVAIDLGEDAKGNPEAVVNLVLNNADINCDIAPAIIFYNVYECCEADEETATKDVDTSTTGANVIIADNSVNNINGSYVAKIYKPDSVVLSDDGKEVEDAKKLHKYDGAFYSKMSMNIDAGEKGNGVLNINADNEGLDSELHLTINSGNINIVSGNDGINTNEDNVSVTTINGGNLNIFVNGSTGEGDGIDSNGWLVINGGTVSAQACATSGDAGIDSDKGIHINGGTVFATGNMLDRISESKQNFAVFTFAQPQENSTLTLTSSSNKTVIENDVTNRFTYLVVSCPELVEDDYTLRNGETKLQGVKAENTMAGGMPQPPEGMMPPEGMTRPENVQPPEGMIPPEEMTRPKMPDGMTMPEGMAPPEGIPDPGIQQLPGNMPPSGNNAEGSEIFRITNGGNYFVSVR